MSTPAAADLPGYELEYSGKVRDLYAPLDDAGARRNDLLLLVASDRISAFDYVLDTPIPDKGRVLTQMSLWWFERLSDLVPNHVVSVDVPTEVVGRAVLVRRLRMVPVECIARAYLTGHGLEEYAATGTASGVPLPPDLVDGSRLPEPIFTPSTKAELGQHDELIDFEVVRTMVGPTLAHRLRELTTTVLQRGNQIAAERGILIADTKVEFGIIDDTDGSVLAGDAREGEVLLLADEVLTPDSSRFWPADQWAPGGPQASYDKQYVRDWLTSPASGWDPRSGEAPPPLPEDVVARTRDRYVTAYESLTGRRFD